MWVVVQVHFHFLMWEHFVVLKCSDKVLVIKDLCH